MAVKFDKPIFITTPLLPDESLLQEKIHEIWKTKWITNHGRFHNELEEKMGQVLGSPNISVVNNGTIALLIALRALGIRSGEVITTPFTFPATPHSISWNNLEPVFCDINPDTFCIDANKIEQLITNETKAIMGVHVFGFPCEVEKIQSIADKYNLKVIYDAAHAFKTTIHGKPIGTFGDISCFSFHATKLFHSIEGGCLAYNDNSLKETVYLLRNFGIQDEETVLDIGINGKMNEIQAAVGLLVLDLVEEERSKRALINDTYRRHLQDIDGLILPSMPQHVDDSYQYFPIRVIASKAGHSRDHIHQELKKYNVISRKYFYPLCSDYVPYKDLPSSAIENLPVANAVKNEILCLPLYGDLGISSTEKICDIIKHIMNK